MKNSKFIEEKVVKALMWVSVSLVILVVASIICTIFVKGFGSLSWDMVTKVPGRNWNTTDDGGFINSIWGSVIVVAPATLIAMVVSIPVVFYMNLYRRRSNWLSYVARLAYDVLYGIPSIVYGAFAFMIMVMVGMRASVLGGIIVSTLLIIPMFIRNGDEISKSVPDDMIDAAYSLGATKWETLKVVVRQVLPGMRLRCWRWERLSEMLLRLCSRQDSRIPWLILCLRRLRHCLWPSSTG